MENLAEIVATRLKALEDMGFSIDLSEAKSDEERLEMLDEVEEMLMGMMGDAVVAAHDQLEKVAPTVDLARDFLADVAPDNAAAVQAFEADFADVCAEEDVEDATQGILMSAYNALAEANHVMTLGHWDPAEIARLLNGYFEIYAKGKIPTDVVDTIADNMEDSDDPQVTVWDAFVQEADARGVAFLEMVPIGGAWSDQAIIMIDKAKRAQWSGKAYGTYGLVDFPQFGSDA